MYVTIINQGPPVYGQVHGYDNDYVIRISGSDHARSVPPADVRLHPSYGKPKSESLIRTGSGTDCARRGMEVGPGQAGWRRAEMVRHTPGLDRVVFDNVVSGDYIVGVRTVGIRELKAKLSEELRAVSRGEVVLVTDRGRVVAELRAPGTEPVVAGAVLDRRIEQWLRDGRARLGDAAARAPYPVSPVSLSPGTAARLLDEIRGDE